MKNWLDFKQEDLDVAMKEKTQRETKSLLTASQKIAIRTNDIKAKIDVIEQNIKVWLCGDRDETVKS